jgi:hypothetical protein
MKSFRYLFVALMGISMISCQKSYNPPDLVISGGGGSGGGTSISGPLLIKMESKTVGSSATSSREYEYDAAKRLIRVLSRETDQTGAKFSYYYRYARDASGRITMIVTDIYAAGNPGVGFPDSVFINVHYPSSTGGFDYTSYQINVSGVSFKDSSVYVYNSSGIIFDTQVYQAVAPSPFALAARQQYVYSGGNLITIKGYDPSVSVTSPSGAFHFEFDSKPAALALGNESFLPGLDAGSISANNMTKHIIDVPGLKDTLQYSYQYHGTTQRPLSAVITQAAEKKTHMLTFTYQ